MGQKVLDRAVDVQDALAARSRHRGAKIANLLIAAAAEAASLVVLIEERFAALGLRLTYGEHVDERDAFDSSSIASRVADLDSAWGDPEVAAILTAQTALVTYSGPHWSSFGMRDHFQQTLAWFTEALFSDAPMELRPSEAWTDAAGNHHRPLPRPLSNKKGL